jgi:hypothetical protein
MDLQELVMECAGMSDGRLKALVDKVHEEKDKDQRLMAASGIIPATIKFDLLHPIDLGWQVTCMETWCGTWWRTMLKVATES